MTSLARGIEVLRAFRDSPEGMTMAEVSQVTGLSRAVVRRCLYTLQEMGYVSRERRVFRPEPKVLTLGQSYLSSNAMPAKAQPFLERVSQRVNESCSLAVLEGDEVMYVGRSATRRIMSVSLDLGSRLPAYCTSLGRVLLAHLDAESLEGYLGRVELMRHTKSTVTTRRKLSEALTLVLEGGYSMVDQELEVGLRSLAVPVHKPDHGVVAALNVGAQAGRVSRADFLQRILPVLLEASGELTALLRY